MNRINLSRRNIGLNFSGTGSGCIDVWAPFASSVDLILPEKGQTLPLKKEDLGYWQLITSLVKPGDRYLIGINGLNAFPDPASLAQPQGVHAASQALDLGNFKWEDDAWQNLPLSQYIFYEIHTGTFTPEGSFEGIEQKLDHMVHLGITVIEIMPVGQFPGTFNWGYDGVYPFAVQDSYGGAYKLQQLVNAAHKKGLAVVLDVVYNHLGPEGNYFSEYGPYFTLKYTTPWGSAINFDDAWSDGVRHYFIENALMWFRDFHIDGLRLDAAHAIKDFGPVHILKELRNYTNLLMDITGKTYYLIVELDLNDPKFINPENTNGLGMDAQWLDEFHHALRVTAGEPQIGYYEDFEGLHHLAKSYRDAYVYDGQYSRHRKKYFGLRAEDNPGQQFVVFSQNHDHIGNRMLGERTSKLMSFEMQKLLAGAVLMSPFLPLLFMGEEYGEIQPFLYFISHSETQLVEAVRKGRQKEFEAFHLNDSAPDPASPETVESSKLQWHLHETEPHKTMYRFYKAVIALRKNHAAFSNLNRHTIDTEELIDNQVLVIHRWHDNEHVVSMLNFSKDRQLFILPGNPDTEWFLLFNSADPVWGGTDSEADKKALFYVDAYSVPVAAESFMIYTNKYV